MQKVIIIDDETAARKMIVEYLSFHPEFIIIGEENNGIDGIKLINKFRPDLLFLDIQMPGLNGFEVIHRLDYLPNIIFATAYDEYAIKAFEVNAVDYLLKPFTKERFDWAINKINHEKEKNFDDIKRLANQLIESTQTQAYPKTILVRKGIKYVTLNIQDIIWVGAEKDYSHIITESGKYLSNHGIGTMEQRLPKEYFIRIHRSTIINISCIAEVFKNPSSYDIKMINGEILKVSRSYLDAIRNIIF